MAVLQRNELEQSPLADLHAIASELGLEGFRRLRREELIAALLSGQDGEPDAPADSGDAPQSPAPARRARRSTRSASRRRSTRTADRDDDAPAAAAPEAAPSEAVEPEPAPTAAVEPAAAEPAPAQPAAAEPAPADEERAEPEAAEETRSGVLEVLANGGGFLRSEGLLASPDDPYVSPAQIRRLELRPGDELSGPVRAPRRSERYPSLVRIESVNGADGEAAVGRKHFDDLTPVWPTERLAAPRELDRAPFGRGSRVAVGGEPGTGASTLLRTLMTTLAERQPELERTIVLAGVRPEELTDWRRAGSDAVVGGAFDRSPGELAAVAELAIERTKRAVEHGRDAVVAIDSLELLSEDVALRVFGAGRKVEEGGSLTVIAVTGSSARPRRLATTRIVLDAGRAGRSPGSVVSGATGTTRADLLG